MRISLNSEQAKGLANFFFDLAKGLLLGGIGSAIFSPEIRLAVVLLTMLSSFILIKMALSMLEIKDEH